MLELTDLEAKMAWLMTDAGMDVAFARLGEAEKQAALSAFEKLYWHYRAMPSMAT